MNDNNQMLPPRPRDKRKREILSEDDYTSAIGEIIEKRYFPDSNFNRSVLNVLEGQQHKNKHDNDNNNSDTLKISENLNEFFKKYTSEDNASFEEIHDKDMEDFKKKYHWAYPINEKGVKEGMLMLYNIGDKKISAMERKEMDKLLDGPTEKGDHRQNMPDTWRFRVRNQLNFPPMLLDSEETCRMHDDENSLSKKPFPLLKDVNGTTNKNTIIIKELKESDKIQNNCTRLPNNSLHNFLSPLVSPLEPPHTPSIYSSENGSEYGENNNYEYVDMTPIYMPLTSKNYNNDSSFSIECASREILARKLDSQNKIKKLPSSSSTKTMTTTKSVKAKTNQNKTIKLTPAALSLAQRISSSSSSSSSSKHMKNHAFDHYHKKSK